jgi:signal transduction histidine kinase/CheY-like chemotaxis protein
VDAATRDSKPASEPLEAIMTRGLLRVRISQMALTVPLIIVSLIAIDFAFQGRVDEDRMRLWTYILSGTAILRGLYYFSLAPKIANATLGQLARYEQFGFVTSILNGTAMGLSFWLVAAHGDLTAQLVITLINCFFAIATIANASRQFWIFFVVTLVHLGQGVLFWFGVGRDGGAQLEVAVPFLAVTLLVLGFARNNSRQFQESLAIRTENLALLEQLAVEKRAVEHALGEARRAGESKGRFLAAASHDLRQPLHALTMFLGTLSFHVTTDDAKRLLGRIKETTDVLRDQFDSLLDLSKFDAGAVQPDVSSFDLASLARNLVEELRPEAEARKLTLVAASDAAPVRSDAVLIERVLRNLLANAVKYTSVGAVTVRTQRRNGEVLVEVSDTGPGIPSDQQGRIFEEYVQLANPARQRRHGVGLGLAIVKRIDDLLRLRLELESTVGAGTTFRFFVPASDEAPPQSVRRDAGITGFRTAGRVWVLDDDPAILESFQEQLAAWGAQVEVFADPEAMLGRLRATQDLPRWIFADDMLGTALSGLETAQMLSSSFGFGRVCLVTGNTEPQRLAQLRGSGFPVIVKPARAEELIAILAEQPGQG